MCCVGRRADGRRRAVRPPSRGVVRLQLFFLQIPNAHRKFLTYWCRRRRRRRRSLSNLGTQINEIRFYIFPPLKKESERNIIRTCQYDDDTSLIIVILSIIYIPTYLASAIDTLTHSLTHTVFNLFHIDSHFLLAYYCFQPKGLLQSCILKFILLAVSFMHDRTPDTINQTQ